MQVEGVHIQREEQPEEPYGHEDDPEAVEDPAYKEVNLRLAHWVSNGSEDLVLLPINAAIKEYYDSI